jgi:hypothetical protein
MAVQGTPLIDVIELTSIESVGPAAYGDLITPFEGVVPDSVEATIRTNRFPTPPIAWGFLTEVIDAWQVEGVEAPYLVGGALTPGGTYLEPNIGQIWPRIG